MRGLLADVVDRRAQLFGRGGDAFDAHRGLAGRLLGHFDPGIGLARYRREAGRGLAHLARGFAKLLQRLTHAAFEFGDMVLDGTLARGRARIAFALLRLDLELVLGLLLEGFERAGKRPDLVLAIEVSGI